METIEFDKLFEPSNKSVLDFYRVSGVGYYIPEYQRGYSWDKDNINQLLTDISEGVERLVDGSADQEIHFLGTIITVIEQASKNKDPKGKPTRIDMIIDGQQRVITISIFASIIVKALIKYQNAFKASSPFYEETKEIISIWIKRLMEIIYFDMSRGKPHFKPRIIRGGVDYWTADGDIDEAYKSELANYQAHFIDSYLEYETNNNSKPSFPSFKDSGRYSENARRLERWINQIAESHLNDNDDYPNASSIINNVSQSLIWDYERPSLKELIEKQFTPDKTKESSALCSLVQIIASCYYLLQRCCFCVIRPANEDWAFDMFQSLNATGTPLTALETFKPVVLNYLKTNKLEYKGSKTEYYFKKVEDFLSEPNTAVLKTRRTNDYVVSFFTSYNGEKVPTHFSGERRALVDSYDQLESSNEKESFIKKMGDYSDFYRLWLGYDGSKSFKLNDVHDESELISLLILFLKNSNHRMAITTLGSIYQGVLDKTPTADQDFVDVVKATAAFYFLWRAAYANNGLDVAYRNLFQNAFSSKTPVNVKSIKEHFVATLVDKGIKKNDWKSRAAGNLKYGKNNNDFIRLALLISSTDTIPDPACKGLIKKGKEGTSNYLKLRYWLSEDLKTIEHVAPQTNPGTWDDELYDQDTSYVNSLGNLTLLPVDLNSSIGNKSLSEKLLYYKCVAEDDQEKLDQVAQKASKLGLTLNDSTVELLKSCKYSQHILPISSLDFCDSWKSDLVKKRTNAILDIIWDRLMSWLQD